VIDAGHARRNGVDEGGKLLGGFVIAALVGTMLRDDAPRATVNQGEQT